MEELISVIIPVFNVEKYINKCLDSIIMQTYRNLEIILIDDGSPDNCGKICDTYEKNDCRFKVIHIENSGVSAARNIGIENSKGKWISFIDSDDWIEKDYFKNMYTTAVEEKADVVLCGYNRVSPDGIEKINSHGENESFNSQEYLINTLNPQTGFGFCHMKLIKRECLGRIKFEEKLQVGEDALFNIMISKNIKKSVFLKKALYNYRINSNSVVKRYDNLYAKKYLYSMKMNKKYLLENYSDIQVKQNYYNFVAFHVMLIAVNYCYHPNNVQNKKKRLKEVCQYDEFKEGIEKSNYHNISLTRKITLFTLKHKLYFITGLICQYRQAKNRKE